VHARAHTVFAPTHRSMSFAVARGDAMCVRQAVKVTASGVGRVARRAAFVRASSRSASSSPQPASPRAAFSAAPLASFGRVGALPSPGGRLRSCARGSSFAFSAAATSASPAEIAAAQEAAAAQGLVVRAIKEKKNAGEASKDEVDAEVAKLLALKKVAADLENPPPAEAAGSSEASPASSSKKTLDVGVTPKSEDYSRWYLDVIRECELADYGPARGTMVIRPYGYALWEGIQRWMDAKFKSTGVENAYFPQLIPYSFITKEASHVEGFAPELAVVTQGGGKELEEPLVVRPTSETIVNHMFSQWIQSYRDLPVLVNQWANVHRWEMRTRPFIRTLEFLWQEGHTAHATGAEAEARAIQMIEAYREFAEDVAAMPVVVGRKSAVESFAGANCTYTIEAMMGDRKALQAGTSHNLGSNFAEAFDTVFLDEDGKKKHVHQSSWGVSTRLIGGIIMTHGDDAGLRLPPKLAPIQVVVVPIAQKNKDKETVAEAAAKIVDALEAAGVRVKLDDDTRNSPGWKFNHWEMKGVPVRVEVGPKDVAKNACVVARRDVPGKEGKEFGVSAEPDALVAKIRETLEDVQASLLREATAFRDENIVDVHSYDELKAAIAAGKWARGGWEGSDEQEKEIKEETGATIRCFPFDQPEGPHACLLTGAPAKEVCIFAKSY
jgi:prolyl-tRNA synthetase